MARLLRVPVAGLEPGEIELAAPQAKYVTRVHRLGTGDRFVAFDPERRLEADATVVSADKRAVRCQVSELRRATELPPGRVILVQAVGKGEKPDRVVGEATALGAAKIVLVQASRSVVAVGDRAPGRRRRWRAIAVEAARQSGRGDIPEILGPSPLDEAVAAVRDETSCGLLLDPDAPMPLAEAIASLGAQTAIALAIGPEGGWSDQERAALKAAGFRPVTLGRFVLRTEVAATAALGAVVARWP